MKRKKFGEKITNWHRPLGRSQLRRRFLVQRHDDPELTQRGPAVDWSVDDDAYDAYWNSYDPYYEIWEITSDDRHTQVMETSLTKILNPSIPFFRPEWLNDGDATDGESKSRGRSVPRRRRSGGVIEDRLADYLAKVVQFGDHSDLLESSIREAMGDRQNLEIVKRVEARSQSPNLAQSVCLFSPFWVRSPRTWDQNGGEAAFLDHLFTLYEVPRFLYSEWVRQLDISRSKWLCWFIVMGQGGSLKRAGELFGWRIPNRFQVHLHGAPVEASPIQACIDAEVKRLGGCEIDVARVIRNRALVIDPTEPSENASHSAFWQGTVRWLIHHRDAMTDEQSDLILSWAMHEYAEAERMHAPPFSWQGRSVLATLERSLAYHQQLKRPWSGYNWSAHGWDWVMDQPSLGRWSFIELTSGEELFYEGEAMHHCVASYAPRCASGYSAIVSLRLDDVRRITVELNPSTKQVIQARGSSNRNATTEEKSVIGSWMNEVVKPDKPRRGS
jgi:hypothetical protein